VTAHPRDAVIGQDFQLVPCLQPARYAVTSLQRKALLHRKKGSEMKVVCVGLERQIEVMNLVMPGDFL
jgi:hypothetical protein